MAVDTELKRRSVIGILPTADGSIDAEDRPVVIGLYSADYQTDFSVVWLAQHNTLVAGSMYG